MLKCENLPRTNSTKYETQNILVKFQQNEHTPDVVSILYRFVHDLRSVVLIFPLSFHFEALF